jgi:DNA-directed RNA polymerase specialized sigma54-like protein
METDLVPKLAELGIGIFAIGCLGYILYVFIKSHRDELNSSRTEREKNQEWFMQYVNANNHQKEEMIKEHIATNVQIKQAIETHTKILEKLIDKLDK